MILVFTAFKSKVSWATPGAVQLKVYISVQLYKGAVTHLYPDNNTFMFISV